MRNIVSVLFLIFFFVVPSLVSAHPGRTDSNGGHTCRTNCTERWGLQYGEYHYHNGGSGGSGGSSSFKPSYNPKVERDKGYNVGYKKGYELGYRKGYNETVDYSYKTDEYKEGWEQGFDEGFDAGIAQIELEEKQKEEKEKGNKDGLSDGEKAFNLGKTKEEYIKTNFDSDFYKEGYVSGFTVGWETSREKKKYYDLGFELGYKQDNLVLDTNTKSKELLDEFEKGFNEGVKKRDNEVTETLQKQGYEDGLALNTNKPSNTTKQIYINAYTEGYEKGRNFMKKEVTSFGHTFAFQSINLIIPEEYKGNKELENWFSEGFNSNELAKEIKEVAFENGKKVFGKSDEVPEEYKEGAKIYQIRYEEGVKKGEERKETMQNAIIGVGVLAGISGGGYAAFKRRKKKNIG